jgi:hypothetical protein
VRAWRLHAARLLTLLALSLARPPLAFGQTAADAKPSTFPIRLANFAWDHDVLRASFSFSDVLTAAVRQKLSNGPASTIVMRAAFYRDGETTPAAIVAQECVVSYDLWAEAYLVKLTTAARTTQQPVINIGGVERMCANAQNLAVTGRSLLVPGKTYYLAVIAEVNPVSEDVRAQLRQWMQRPAGAAEVGPGGSLFSAFVLLLFRDVGGSDSTVEFRTAAFQP